MTPTDFMIQELNARLRDHDVHPQKMLTCLTHLDEGPFDAIVLTLSDDNAQAFEAIFVQVFQALKPSGLFLFATDRALDIQAIGDQLQQIGFREVVMDVDCYRVHKQRLEIIFGRAMGAQLQSATNIIAIPLADIPRKNYHKYISKKERH